MRENDLALALEAAQRRAAEAEERLLALGLAARSLAHAINNDLTMIGGTLDLIEAQGYVPADTQFLVQHALAEVTAIGEQVSELQRLASDAIRGQAREAARGQR
jgi:hypothetical protein